MIKIFFCLVIFVFSSAGFYIIISYMIKRISKTSEQITKLQKGIKLSQVIKELSQKSKKQIINIKLLIGLFCFFILFIVTGKVFISLPFAILGFFVPGFTMAYVKKKEIDKFNNQLIDGLIIIANSLRAGASFAQALEILSRDSKPPLSTEITKVTQEVKLGTPMAQALLNMSSRVESKELDFVVTTVNIARETGGSLPELLNRVAETMRERNKLQGKINALTAQGKMSGYIVGSMPFLLMALLYLIAPEIIEPMFTTLIGNVMIGVIVILVAIGGILIKKIVTIDI